MTYNMQIKNILLFFTFLLIALPGCYIGLDSTYLRVACLAIITVFAGLLLIKPNYVIGLFIKYSKNIISILMLLLFSWIVLDTFICSYLELCSMLKSLLAILFRFVPLVIIPYYLGIYIARHFSQKQIIKFYSIIFLFILFVGVLDIVCSLTNFPLLSYTISNHRTIIANEVAKAIYLGINRVQSVFDEPSYFGMFLSVHFFMICAIADSKYKVFKNKILNFLLKKCSFYLVWLCLFFSMSPMYIFIIGLQTLIYKFILNNKNIKKQILNISIFTILSILFIFIFYKYDFEGTFLERIHNTLISLASINALVAHSDSLANRIINYYAQILVFLNHPLTGVSFGAVAPHLYSEFSAMKIPLTGEIKMWLQNPNSIGFNNAFLWTTIAENGVIALVLLIGIFFSAIKIILRKLKTTRNQHNHKYLTMFFSILVMSCLLSIYDSGITLNYIWFAVGITAGMPINVYYKKA